MMCSPFGRQVQYAHYVRAAFDLWIRWGKFDACAASVIERRGVEQGVLRVVKGG